MLAYDLRNNLHAYVFNALVRIEAVSLYDWKLFWSSDSRGGCRDSIGISGTFMHILLE